MDRGLKSLLRLGIILICALLLGAATATAALMLPRIDDGSRDIRGWLMSEKLDGVRGRWDGRQLFSRSGQLLQPPPEFVAGLPPFPIEGELWGGRGRFQQTVSAIRRPAGNSAWLQLRFAIFDLPAAAGGFQQRIARATTWFDDHPTPYAFVIEQRPLRNREQLQRELKRVEELGGEGLIVRRPDAPYSDGRSADILKVKSYQDDEATVIGHLPGQGRNSDRLGALLVRLADGTEFKIGSGLSDAERDHPPAVGTLISFKYYGRYQSGIPRFPSYLRIRSDSGL